MTAFILDSSATTTILDVVNQMIGSLGETPVATYDPPPTSDVELALGALNEADKAIQRKGWEWNRNYGVLVALDSIGQVVVPDGTFRAVLSYATNGDQAINASNGQAIKAVLRGPRMYDQINNTYIWGSPLLLDTIQRLQWDDIPDDFRAWISYRALQIFQGRVQQSAIVLKLNVDDLNEARNTCEQQQDNESSQNAVGGSIAVRSALYGIGGMRRNRGNY